jgi:hypothetical protein
MTIAKLHMINDVGKSDLLKKMRYEDFNSRDKEAMVELFVCNPVTLHKIYRLMFPTTRKVPHDYPNLSLIGAASNSEFISNDHNQSIENFANQGISITEDSLSTER